jgi:hypothetical protein
VKDALAFRASEITMRLNAPKPAFLALALLLFSSAWVLAIPTHHLAHKSSGRRVSASSRQSVRRKAAAARVKQVRDSRHHAGKSAHVAVARRVREESPRGRRQTQRREVSQRKSATRTTERTLTASATRSHTRSQAATSQDFLEAASGHAQVQAPLAIHGTARPDEPRASRVSSRARRHGSAARQVAVVSVIRPAANTPRLRSVEEDAATPVILPSLYNKRGRLIMPRALKGSHEILVHQNEVADQDGLQRIQNDSDLETMRDRGMLVSLPLSAGLEVDERLPENRRYCRPWTAQFLANLSRAHYAHFHTPLQVNSAVRTVEFQEHLMHINGNAAPADGDTASPHLTGQAVDLAKHGLSLSEIAWMRGYLLPLVQEGKIDVEEEFKQSCFHISVYKHYLPTENIPERDLASSHREGVPALATAVR